MQLSRTLFLALSLLVSSACSGSGSGPAGGVNSNDGGTYTEEDFDYEDPHAASFHPMGRGSATLTPRDELVIINVPEQIANARATLFDDIGAGAGVLGEVADLLEPGPYRTGASGNLDDDAEEELVMIRASSSLVLLSVVEHQGSNAYGSGFELVIPASGFDYHEVRLSLGDVDGDHRDEFLIVAREREVGDGGGDTWMRIYDDPIDGAQLLFEFDWAFPASMNELEDMQAVAADLDGDGKDEVALMLLHEGTEGDVQLCALDDSSANFAHLVPWFEVEDLSLSFADVGARLVAGDFDGDRKAELAVARWEKQSTFASTRLQSFDFEAATLSASPVRNFYLDNLSIFGSLYSSRAFDALSFDIDGDGQDGVALLIPGEFLHETSRILTMNWDGAGWQDGIDLDLPAHDMDDSAAMVATDDDADGQDEIYFCRMRGSSSSSTKSRLVHRIDWGDGGNPITNTWDGSVAQTSGHAYPPVLVAGDFDADGLAIRYTGRKFTSLADPMPMVVLSAAPTKSGIGQRYDLTSTGYEIASGSSMTHGVTSSTTVSAYSGVSIEDVFGLFDASARQTVAKTFATSETQTVSQTTILSYAGAYDYDSIVFQGTLYQSYEYEVLSAEDPTLVGTLFTFDVPVEARVYKWTVDLYNERVEPEQRIGAEILSHTIGDPASYRSASEVQALTSQFVGWWTSTPQTLGQNNFHSGIAIELETQATTETQRSFDVTWEAGFSVGGAEFGGSFGITESEIYSVTVSELTHYDGFVGDVLDVQSYDAWRYDFGLGVYHNGLLSNGSNEPVGQVPGTLPYQIVTFWVDPTGAAY